MSAIDDFEDAVYRCLNSGISEAELYDWLDSYASEWYEINAEDEQDFLSPDEAAASQAVNWAEIVEQIGADAGEDDFVIEPGRCSCGYLGLCDGCTEPMVEQIKGDPPYIRVPDQRTTDVEDRLTQVESLLNRLYDEVRKLNNLTAPKTTLPPRYGDKRTTELAPYLPPPVIPDFPHNPLHPWASSPLRTTCGGGNNCRCGSH